MQLVMARIGTLLFVLGCAWLLSAYYLSTEPEVPVVPAATDDGAILAQCMNGVRISLGDGHVLRCKIGRKE